MRCTVAHGCCTVAILAVASAAIVSSCVLLGRLAEQIITGGEVVGLVPDAADCRHGAPASSRHRCRAYLVETETLQGRLAAARYASVKSGRTSPSRLAIATWWDGSRAYECALPPWCFSARQLAQRLPWVVELVVLSPPHASTAECQGEARFVTRHFNRTADSISAYVARRGSWRSEDGVVHASVLHKVSVLGLIEYDLVLFADLDVNLSPVGLLPNHPWWWWSQSSAASEPASEPEAVGMASVSGSSGSTGSSSSSSSSSSSVSSSSSSSGGGSSSATNGHGAGFRRADPLWARVVEGVWAAHLGAFLLAEGVLVAGHPDHESPINTGIMLVKPRQWLYDSAVRSLARVRWSPSAGFQLRDGEDGEGKVNDAPRDKRTPRQLANSSRLLEKLLLGTGGRKGYLQEGGSHSMTHARLWETLEHIGHVARDTWRFVGGEHDQGFFWHLIFLTHNVGTWLTTVNAAAPLRNGSLSARHTATNLAAFVSRADHFWGIAGRNRSKPWARGDAPTCTRAFLSASARRPQASGANATSLRVLRSSSGTRCGRQLRRRWAQTFGAPPESPPGCYGAMFRLLPSFACTREGDAAGVPCARDASALQPSWISRAWLHAFSTTR